MEEFNYWWTFEVKDVVDFAETSIQVSATEYKEAIKKIYKLQIPSLERYTDIGEHLKLKSVIEADAPEDELILEHEPE
jgi:hypothetical protein